MAATAPIRKDTGREIGHDVVLERRLKQTLEGEVAFDLFTRGRYATDASIYQIVPRGVVFPKSEADMEATLSLAREHGVAVIARGGEPRRTASRSAMG